MKKTPIGQELKKIHDIKSRAKGRKVAVKKVTTHETKAGLKHKTRRKNAGVKKVSVKK